MSKFRIFCFLSICLLSSQVHALTFKVATLSPDGSFWMQKMRAGAAEVSQRTSNRVKFKFYPGGVMGSDQAVLRKIRMRQLHGAALTNGGLTDIYPDIRLYNLILKFNSLTEIDYVRARMDKHLMQGLEKNGMVNFGFVEMGQAYLMSLNPIYTLADLKGEKAWVPSNNKLAQAAFEAFQVSPIPLSTGDVLMGLQTGMINVAAGSPVGALALQWHTQVKYITELPISYIFGIFVIEQKSFNKISAADQQIVREVFGKVAQEVDQQSRTDNLNAIQALKNQQIEFIQPTAEAIDELKNQIGGINAKLIEETQLTRSLAAQLDAHLQEFRSQRP